MKTLPLLIALSAFLVVGACESPMDGDVTDDPTTPTSILRLSNGQERVDICHRTGSETNPWVLINVAEPSVDKHRDRHGDLFPGEAIDDELMLDLTCAVGEIAEFCGGLGTDLEDSLACASFDGPDGDTDKPDGPLLP